jgi:biotin operon repressor
LQTDNQLAADGQTLVSGQIRIINAWFKEVLRMGRKPKVSKEQIIELTKAGKTGAEIAEKLQITRQYVKQVLDQARKDNQLEGIETSAIDVSDTVSRIIKLSAPMSTTNLAVLIGAPRESVWKWLNKKASASGVYARRLDLLLSALERAAKSTATK